LVPPRGRRLRLGGRSVRVIDEGAGPPVVLIHGLGGQAENFAALTPHLAGFRRLSIDRAGAGRSAAAPPGAEALPAQAARIAAVMEAAATGPAVVVGHSLGGAVALQLAADRPDLVRGLVLCGALTQPDFPRLSRFGARLGAAPALREGVAHLPGVPALGLVSPWLLWLCFTPDPMPPGFLRWGGGMLVGQPRAIAGVLRDARVVAEGIDEHRAGVEHRAVGGVARGGEEEERLAQVAGGVEVEIVERGKAAPLRHLEPVGIGKARRAAFDPARAGSVAGCRAALSGVHGHKVHRPPSRIVGSPDRLP